MRALPGSNEKASSWHDSFVVMSLRGTHISHNVLVLSHDDARNARSNETARGSADGLIHE
jgi:hypothetical protein